MDGLGPERADVRVPLVEEGLYARLPACVVHPRERDVGCERVVAPVDAGGDRLALDGVGEGRERRLALADADPHHPDVVAVGNDPEAAETDGERVDVDAPDGGAEGVAGVVRVGVAEELQRQVCVGGVGPAERVGQVRLERGQRVTERVGERDGDEQAHSRPEVTGRLVRGAVGDRTAGAGDARLSPGDGGTSNMTDDEPHEFSAGEGFEETDYDAFTLDPDMALDPDEVGLDSRVLTDILDGRQTPGENVDAAELLDVGLSYVGIQRFEEATETLERAARFAEDDLLAQEAWVNAGVAHAELEEYDEAIGAYREALRIDEDSEHAASAETNLAYALWEFGHTEEALEHAERAVELDPRFAQAWYNRGFFLAERGLYEEAVDALDNAVRLGMRSAEVHEERSRALDELGEREAAEEAQTRADELREERERSLVDEGGERDPPR